MASDVVLSSDHPLVLELESLQEAVDHFQSEAHRATVQLRHQSLDHATLLKHLHALENENTFLRTELQVHRATGPVGAHRDALQVQELTLALRRLSDKLDLTEKAVLERNEELTSVQSERDSAKKAEASAMETAKRLRSEVNASNARERDLARRVKASEEQRRMTDLAVEEYASLVRSLEGRSSISRTNGSGASDSTRNSLDGLMHARQGLQKLLQDSNYDSEQLHAEIDRLRDLLESTRSELEVERAMALEHKQTLARIQLELHQLKCDDNAAAKMVSRYMKFSQSSTDLLHGAIEKLKARQEGITTSYEARLQQLEDRLASEKRQSEMLRRALDELTEDISREAYGRRREIVLRLLLLAREEMFTERLRRWLLRSHEILQKMHSPEKEDSEAVFEKILEGAQSILTLLNGTNLPVSSAARLFAAHATVKVLQVELQREMDKRLYFEYQLANSRSEPIRTKGLVARRVVLSDSPGSSVITRTEPSEVPPNSINPTSCSTDRHTDRTTHVPDDLVEQNEHKLFADAPDSKSGPSERVGDDLSLDGRCRKGSDHALMSSSIVGESVSNENKDGVRSTIPASASGSDTYNGSLEATSERLGQSDALDSNGLSEEPGTHSHGVDETLVSAVQQIEVGMGSGSGAQINSANGLSSSRGTEAKEVLDEGAVVASHQVPTQEHAGIETLSTLPQLSMPQDERYRSSSSLRLEGSDYCVSETSDLKGNSNEALLSKLADVDERYADMQRSFRDCHLALQNLQQASTGAPNPNIFNIAIERLSDYCEDARVELEIRISDEERVAKGFQTLLSVPGAFSDEVNEQEVLRQIEAFLDGSDPAVQRSQEILKRKLDDLEHDIASIKYAMHSSASPMLASEDLQEPTKVQNNSGWTSWTGSILGSSRSPSPAPSFGAVMTSPHLRHSSSTRSLRGETNNVTNPLANLRLRVPMPNNFHHQGEHPPSPTKQRARHRAMPNLLGLGLRGGLRQGISRSSLSFTSNLNTSANPASDKESRDLDNDIE
ncbi:hypothetical protein A7U60_g8876 [Sanghuangporus baumii]|uniref:Uncharacterized protein n=1 Tax=Sanghuangporus baumii TaxID=108892 RepID=A0A9Q5HQR1_SANBA|nr:hypothetical protein A7U60_g8876 [Sanghuangporus baumii]